MNYKDNDSFGGGSYPEPDNDYIEVEGTITITYRFRGAFDDDMTLDDIREYIEANPLDYNDIIVEVDDVTLKKV